MSAALQGPSGQIPLGTAPLVIGYTPDNKLTVNDPQISSNVAMITARGQGYTITAINSAYTVAINRQQLVSQQAHWLHSGDAIHIGEMTFTYYEENQLASSTPLPPTQTATNPHVYDLNDEATIKGAPGTAIEEMQASPVQQVASPEQAPVEQKPLTPMPAGLTSAVQWPQYQLVGSDPYTPPSAPPPFSTPAAMAPGGTVAAGVPSQIFVAPQRQSRSSLFTLLIIALAVVIVLVAGGSGALIYQVTRPQPIIALSSQYMQSYTPVGTANTSLHVLGYKFSGNSPITFLLDNQPMTGQPKVHSDGNGNFHVDLPITASWSVGIHTLTAKDSGGYRANNNSNVRIVNQGEAGTPGPNGAPSDDSSFMLKLTLKQYNSSAAPSTNTLAVKGNSRSGNATVCDELSDDGHKIADNGSAQGGLTYSTVYTYTCKGTYQGGKLSYTETLNSFKATYSNGSTCQITSPITAEQLQGTFSSATTLSGTYTDPGFTIPCTAGLTLPAITDSTTMGKWTGTIA